MAKIKILFVRLFISSMLSINKFFPEKKKSIFSPAYLNYAQMDKVHYI